MAVTVREFHPTMTSSSSAQPGNVTKLTDEGLFRDQVVYSKFSWPAVLGGDEVYIWGGFGVACRSCRDKTAQRTPTIFVLPALLVAHWDCSHTVALAAGSFNDWTKGVKLHKIDRSNDAVVIMPLKPGTYEVRAAKGLITSAFRTCVFRVRMCSAGGVVGT